MYISVSVDLYSNITERLEDLTKVNVIFEIVYFVYFIYIGVSNAFLLYALFYINITPNRI